MKILNYRIHRNGVGQRLHVCAPGGIYRIGVVGARPTHEQRWMLAVLLGLIQNVEVVHVS